MPHPFLGVGRYPWSLPEAQALHKALYQTVKRAKDIDLIYQECSINLPPLEEQAASPMWKDALEGIADAGLLGVLGQRIDARIGLSLAQQAFRDAVALPDPVQAAVLSGDRIFLNRDKLRTEVDRMGSGGASAGVLVVRGERASGKSWTRHIVIEQAKAMGEKPIVMAQGVVASPGDVLDRIFSVLDGKAPKKLTTEAAWYTKACSEMIRFAEKSKRQYRRYWIVVDDLGAMDPAIRAFFEQAALNMIDDAFASRFRLVLIDYPEGPLPTNWKKGYWVEDRTAQGDVQTAAVATFLSRWAAGKNKLLTDEKAKDLANDVLAKAQAPAQPGDARPLLERLHDELKAVLDTL